MIKRFIVAVCLTTSLHAQWWSPYLQLDGNAGGYRQGAGIYLFNPICQNDNQLIFGQALAGHYLDNWTGALGVGYRKLCNSVVIGANAFVDIAYSQKHRTYPQGGLGFEVLAPCWEARINGYLTGTRDKCVDANAECELYLVGIDLFRRDFDRLERAYSGFDAEVGYGFQLCRSSVWGYAGYYHFTHHIYGPRLRLEYRRDHVFQWQGAEIILGGVYEYDRTHGHRGTLELGLRIPLFRSKSDCCPLSSLRRRMGNLVRRQESVLTARRLRQSRQGDRAVITPDGNQWHVIFINGGTGGAGTQADPTNIPGAETLYDTYDFLVGLNNAGPIAGTLDLLDDQTLLGFNGRSELTLSVQGCSLTLTDFNGRANFTQTAAPAINLANNNTLSGFAIGTNGENGGSDSIFGSAVVNTILRDLIIENPTDDAINLATSSSNTLIENVDIRLVVSRAVELIGADDTVIRGVSIDGSMDDGIRFAGNPTNILIEDVTLTGIIDRPITIAGATDVVIRNAMIASSGDDGIFFNNITNVLIEDSDISSTVDHGIQLNNANGTLIVRNNRVTDIPGGGTTEAIQISTNANTSLIVDNNFIRGQLGAGTHKGIDVNLNAGTTTACVRIANNTISDINNDAIEINTAGGVSATARISGNTFDAMTGGSAIAATSSGSSTLNLTVTNNVETNSTAAPDAYVFTNPGSGDMCVTMTSNNSNRPAPQIAFTESGTGTLSVTELTDIPANNNGMTFTTSGTITDTDANCPTCTP